MQVARRLARLARTHVGLGPVEGRVGDVIEAFVDNECDRALVDLNGTGARVVDTSNRTTGSTLTAGASNGPSGDIGVGIVVEVDR